MSARHRPALALLATAGLVLAVAAPANAKIVERWEETVSESGYSTDFCGVTGLSPAFTFDATFSGSLKSRGPDSPLYFHEHTSTVVTFTYEGMTVTEIVPNTLNKDLQIVENEDGTLTITALLTGATRVVGSDGKILSKNDGQVRLLLIIDPETGDVLSEEVVFGSTGTNGEFCAPILEHWGIDD